MPSFNRLLVLAVVALSASVYSAPVAEDVPRDLANVRRVNFVGSVDAGC